MPAKSKAQQELFGIALAVRIGDLERSKVSKEVLDLVDSDITTKDLEDFARTKHKGLKDHVKECLAIDNFPRAFIMIKPEFLKYRKEILDLFKANYYVVIASSFKWLTLDEARELYLPHKNEPFYDDLCKYMSSGLSEGILITYRYDCDEKRGNHISQEAMIKQVASLKDKIREKYGVSEMKNVLHSSDSVENVERESEIYF